MTNLKAISVCSVLLMAHTISGLDYSHSTESKNDEDQAALRDRRGIIEEERYYNIRSDNNKDNTVNEPTPWLPQPLPPEDDPTTKISLTNEVKEVKPLFYTTERVTDKPTGRGARASNENWIKLPFPNREQDNINPNFAPPQPSDEFLNSRMPRVNFVTQNKALQPSESRNDKDSVQRSTRIDELRTEFVRPGEAKPKDFKPVYPRQAIYYPDESRRYLYDDKYFPADELYKRDPYNDSYDRRRNNDYPYLPRYVPRIDRYDDESYSSRKPKRIIYYAHLPEVVRTPPSVDLRYRYTVDPYRRLDEDYYGRSGRYDYRFRNRYPYAPLRKEERNYRDLAGSGSANKDKKIDEKITATPILSKKDDKFKEKDGNSNHNRNIINSHQYHDSSDVRYGNLITNKKYPDDVYLRYDEPLFQTAIEDTYRKRY